MALQDPDGRVRIEEDHRRFRLAANARPFAPGFHVHCPLITPASTKSNAGLLGLAGRIRLGDQLEPDTAPLDDDRHPFFGLVQNLSEPGSRFGNLERLHDVYIVHH